MSGIWSIREANSETKGPMLQLFHGSQFTGIESIGDKAGHVLMRTIADALNEGPRWKADAERLDWLEQSPGVITTGVGSAKWWMLGQREFAANKATTLRAAITAAMQEGRT